MSGTISVAATIIQRDGRVLAARRTDSLEGPGWEFPGGKLRPGETGEQAVRREVLEELGARLQVVWSYDSFRHDTPEARIEMEVFVATLEPGEEPRALEHAELAWLGRDDLAGLAWLPVDAQVASSLGHYWDDVFVEEHL